MDSQLTTVPGIPLVPSVIARPLGRRPRAYRWKDHLLGPPLATSRLVRERLRKRVRPDTEVTVLLPRHGDRGRFRRLLHDQTGRDLFAALNRLAGVNVAVVHPPAAAPRQPAAGVSARSTVP